MDLVHEREEERQRNEEEQEMADQEVGAPERQLDDLDHKLSCRLAERMRTETTSIPLACPPRPVRLIVLELARKEDRDEDLEDRTFNEDDGDHTENRV